MKSKRDKQPVHFSLIRQLVLADLITLANASSGTLSILSSITYLKSTQESYIHTASWLLVASLIFDILDGYLLLLILLEK